MKVFITKYALTKGIIEREVEEANCCPGMVSTEGKWMEHYHGEGREWHKTKDLAIHKAEEMRIKKLQSLDNQIKKLSKLKF